MNHRGNPPKNLENPINIPRNKREKKREKYEDILYKKTLE
jgi:hypothetical protein